MRTATTNLVLLRQLRDHKRRLFELEIADLDRQIIALESASPRPKRVERDLATRETDRNMLRVIQDANAPMRTSEIITRFGASRPKVTLWLASMVRRGHLVRVRKGLYSVAKEVPKL